MQTPLRFSFSPWNWVRSSFRAKLTLAFFCIISLFLIAIYIIYYQRSKTEIEQNTYDNLDHMAEQTVSSIQMYMENIHNVAWGYFSDTGLQDFLVEMNEKGVTNFTKVSYYHGKLDTTLVFNTFIGTIALYDMNGHGILTSGSRIFPEDLHDSHR